MQTATIDQTGQTRPGRPINGAPHALPSDLTTRPDQTEAEEPDQTIRPDRGIDWSDVQTRARLVWSRLHDLIGLVPLIAPLMAAGYYQADLARSAFGWHMPWALVFPLSIEAGAAWAAVNYHRKLVAGDSTIGARLGMLSYAGASAGLLYWHARTTGKPVVAAVAIGGMTLAAVWIWTQRAKHAKRDVLRRKGLVDKQAPHFSAVRWILCPIETAGAFRAAVKYGWSDPSTALAAYRDRPTRPARQTGTSDQTGQTSTKAEHSKKPDQTATQTRPADQTSRPDQQLIAKIQTSRPDWQTRPPSASQIRSIIGGGQTRALRLRTILKEIAA